MSLMTEVMEFKKKLEEKEVRIVALETKVKNLEPLEQRVQDLELFTRKEDVIISGMEIKPWLCAAAVRREGEELPMKEQESVETQVVHFK